jgi:hypothetical protein
MDRKCGPTGRDRRDLNSVDVAMANSETLANNNFISEKDFEEEKLV